MKVQYFTLLQIIARIRNKSNGDFQVGNSRFQFSIENGDFILKRWKMGKWELVGKINKFSWNALHEGYILQMIKRYSE